MQCIIIYVTRMLREHTNISKHTNTRVNERNTQQPLPGITRVAHIRTSTRFNKQTKQNGEYEQKKSSLPGITSVVNIRTWCTCSKLYCACAKQNSTPSTTVTTHIKSTEACTTTTRLTPQRTTHKKRTKQKLQTKEKAIAYMLLTSRNNATSSA